MSTDINGQLFERAADMIDYFEGKLPAQVIEQDLANNDLEELALHVAEAESIVSQEEFEQSDIY